MFYATEIALREQLKYPPFCDIIVISFNGSNEADIKNKSDLVYRYLKDKLENKFKIFIPNVDRRFVLSVYGIPAVCVAVRLKRGNKHNSLIAANLQ